MRVAELLLGEATAVDVMPIEGLKELAVGLGLNSNAFTLNLAEVAEGGPLNDAAF